MASHGLMRRYKLPVVLLLLVVSLLLRLAPVARERAVVERVVDGDTLAVVLEGKHERVRMLHINTPESVHPDEKQNIPAGVAASEFVKQQLTGRAVELEASTENRDKYGRLLRYVYVDGRNFCVELVRAGHSPFYTAYGKGQYRAQFEAAEREAREAKRGIWSDPELTEKYLRLKSKWGAGGRINIVKAEAEQ